MKNSRNKSTWFATRSVASWIAVLIATGCTNTNWQNHSHLEVPSAPQPAPAQVAIASETAAPQISTSAQSEFVESTNSLLRLTKSMPAEISLGSEFVVELTITAQGHASNVVVRDSLPAGASYVRSEPAATIAGNQLTWNLGNLEAGQLVKGKVWFKADKEVTWTSSATITGDSRASVPTVAGHPVLAIDYRGPTNAVLGTEVTYNTIVKNTGTAGARNVIVTNLVPAGFSHSSGRNEIRFEVGDLAPGQAKPLAVTFKANQRGKICSTATATSSNADQVSAEACTVILVPRLKVEMSGTKEQILGRNADFEIVVTNTGDTTLNNVVITDIAPAETAIVAAPGARIEGNQATWTIAELKSGAKVTQTIKLTSRAAGPHCSTVTASSGGLNDSAKACTLWKGIPAVNLEVVDEPDPIQIGESTTYTIKVTNQGFADINNLKIRADFGEEVAPVSSPQGTVNGRTVTFPVVAKLGAKQVLTFTITVKGVSVGDSRNKITLTAGELKSPVTDEESTTIY
jgi:uncharacterized repeat protein (TIGR01451 family)